MSESATPAEIEAEIVRNRAELQRTIDELSQRLDPRTQAKHAVDEAKVAAADLKRRITGELPDVDEPEATRTGWIILGAGAAVAAAIVATIIRKL